MRIRNVEVIIPTWNSMPELKDTLESLIPALGSSLSKVILVDKYSSDSTIDTAINWGNESNIPVMIVFDGYSLGHARKTGLKRAQSKWVVFVDSDIVLPKNWLNDISKYVVRYVAWVYGVTKEDIPFVEKAHEWKRQLKNNLPRTLQKGEFERAYTNNTLCLRRPLLDAPIEDLNAWEDYVMGQHMISKGYKVKEVPVFCEHLKHGVYEKFGYYSEYWGSVGELKAKGWNPYTLMRPLYFAYWGIRCAVHFKDLQYFKYYARVCLGMYYYILKSSKAYAWSRD